MENVLIKKLISKEDINNGLKLSLRVFSECNHADYNNDGFNHFNAFINNDEQVSQLTMYGAFSNNSLVGILAFKEKGNHISLFFVDKKFQNLKIGKKLFLFALQDLKNKHILVNSSTYAVDIYEKLGFNVVRNQVTLNGLTSVLMEYRK